MTLIRREVNIFHDLTAASFILEPYYVNKYDERGPNVLENGDNYIIARYADLLLMHAEAINALDASDSKAYDLFKKWPESQEDQDKVIQLLDKEYRV